MPASVIIPLVTGGETVVDESDASLMRFRWYLHAGGYAYRQTAQRNIYMHRCILGEPHGYVDHINRNRLDNRRSNLRVVSNSINMLNAGPRSSNRSGHVGVCRSRNGKWRAYLTKDYRQQWLGTFDSIEDAVTARLGAERRIDPGRFNA